MRYLICIILLALVLATAGCTQTQEVATPATETIAPTPTPEPTVTRPLPGMDPIIGSWDNGMVINADGTVGTDGLTAWKVNDMQENSYFITVHSRAMVDTEAGRSIDPSAQSTEWIYNPYSDTIHIRGASAGVRRVLEGSVSPAPSATP